MVPGSPEMRVRQGVQGHPPCGAVQEEPVVSQGSPCPGCTHPPVWGQQPGRVLSVTRGDGDPRMRSGQAPCRPDGGCGEANRVSSSSSQGHRTVQQAPGAGTRPPDARSCPHCSEGQNHHSGHSGSVGADQGSRYPCSDDPSSRKLWPPHHQEGRHGGGGELGRQPRAPRPGLPCGDRRVSRFCQPHGVSKVLEVGRPVPVRQSP